MMKKVKSFLLFLTFFILITYFSFGQKELVTDDEIYENNIKTVLLYPTANVQDTSTVDMRSPPIVPINQNPPLRLEFDEIGSDFQNYFIKIVNCNADWSISQLNAIQYLNDYNEFQISERKLSFNTRVPYVHYGIFLPRVKISGNYLVVVYKGGDDKDIILSKIFLVDSIEWTFTISILSFNRSECRVSNSLINSTSSIKAKFLILWAAARLTEGESSLLIS